MMIGKGHGPVAHSLDPPLIVHKYYFSPNHFVFKTQYTT